MVGLCSETKSRRSTFIYILWSDTSQFPAMMHGFFFHSFQQNAELLTTLLAHNFGHKFDVWFSWAGQQLGKNFKLQLRAGFCSLTTGQMANLLIC